jgi:hypothetical protein
MNLEKTVVTSDLLQSEMALELPRREMLLVTVVITNLLNGINIPVNVEVKNNNIAVQVCAVIAVLNTAVGTNLTCELGQRQ